MSLVIPKSQIKGLITDHILTAMGSWAKRIGIKKLVPPVAYKMAKTGKPTAKFPKMNFTLLFSFKNNKGSNKTKNALVVSKPKPVIIPKTKSDFLCCHA